MFDCESFVTNLVGHSYSSFMSAQAVRVFVDPGHATSYNLSYLVINIMGPFSQWLCRYGIQL